MIALLFALAMGFTVPAMAEDFNQSFTAQKSYEEMRISWFPVDDVVKTCNTVFYKKPYNDKVVACAQRIGIVCTIFTKRDLDLAVLGHEIRHCFEGGWHD